MPTNTERELAACLYTTADAIRARIGEDEHGSKRDTLYLLETAANRLLAGASLPTRGFRPVERVGRFLKVLR